MAHSENGSSTSAKLHVHNNPLDDTVPTVNKTRSITNLSESEKSPPAYNNDNFGSKLEYGTIVQRGDETHRKLKPRHIQLIGIGGTIGTTLYVQIGKGLMNGGPASLFIAFSLW